MKVTGYPMVSGLAQVEQLPHGVLPRKDQNQVSVGEPPSEAPRFGIGVRLPGDRTAPARRICTFIHVLLWNKLENGITADIMTSGRVNMTRPFLEVRPS